MVDASVPEVTTACFLNVKSDYFETKYLSVFLVS